MFKELRSTLKQQNTSSTCWPTGIQKITRKLFELSGTDNPVALDNNAPIILRVTALLKAEASTMIHLLKNRPYTEHLMSLTQDNAPDLTDKARKIRDDFIYDGVFPEDVAENRMTIP